MTGTRPAAEEPPLCVDLDGTLITTDLLHESFVAALKRSPWVALQSLAWLASGGRARLKEELAARGEVDVATLPYRPEVVQFLREEHAAGRRILLATASCDRLARDVASHLRVFEDVVATTPGENMKGEVKAKRLVERCAPGGFDYVGDSPADRAVWRRARFAYVVGDAARLTRGLPEAVAVKRVFAATGGGLPALLGALRPHQWAKNLLVLVPLVAAHRLGDIASIGGAALGFAAFCLAASSAYLLNDLLDLRADRQHPRKRSRPLASGALSIPVGAALCAACLALAALVASALPVLFGYALLGYFLLTVLYSFVLKRIVLMDVIALASLYAVRIIAGAFAIAADISAWMLAFAMFLFFSLALVKRYAELVGTPSAADALPGRGYMGADRPLVLAMGTSSAMMSALVLALYINGDTVRTLYSHPQALWLLCPLLLYWIARIWLLATRGRMDDDPVLFAVRDSTSYFVAAAGSGVVWLAT